MKFSVKLLLTFFGGVLIIGSTALSGILSFQKDQEIADLQDSIASQLDSIRESKRLGDSAYLNFLLSNINTAITSNLTNDDDLNLYFKTVWIPDMQLVLFQLIGSSQNFPSGNKKNEYVDIIERASKHDMKALVELKSVFSSLILEAANMEKRFIAEKTTKLVKIEKLRRDSIRLKYIAIFIQIFGLVLMLMKDVSFRADN